MKGKRTLYIPVISPARLYRRDRWSFWLAEQLRRFELTPYGLAGLITKRQPSLIKGTANLIQSWLLKKRTVRAQTAFRVGQVLAKYGAPDVNGITALYAAGYLVEVIQTLAQIAGDGISEYVVAAFFSLMPLIHANLDRVEEPNWSVDAMRRLLIFYIESAYPDGIQSAIDEAWYRAFKLESAWTMEAGDAWVLRATLAVARSDVSRLPVIWSMMVHSTLIHFVARVDKDLSANLELYCQAVMRTLPTRPIGEYSATASATRNAFPFLVPMLDGKTAQVQIGNRRITL